MSATTNSLFNTHSNRIEEVLNKNIEMFLPQLDPVWEETVVTNQGIIPFDQVGRDMLYIKTYMGSLAGVIEPDASVRKDFVLYGDDQTDAGFNGTTPQLAKLHTQGLDNVWPDATKGPMAKPYQLAVPMRAMITNLMLTLGEMQAEATPAFIGEVIGPKMEGFAKNVAHTLCNYWYTSQNSNYALCTFNSSVDDTIETDGATVNVIDIVNHTDEAGAIDRFAVGQMIDIYASGGDRKNAVGSASGARIRIFVTAVDELAGTISVCAENLVAHTSDTINLADNDYIVLATEDQQTNFKGIAGIRSWLKTGIDSIDGSGSDDHKLLGGESVSGKAIDVTIHPEFKSLGITSVGSLTEHKLRKYLSRFHAAKNKYGQYIDCLVASDGVWTAYEATRIGRETIDRTRSLSTVNQGQGSEDGFQFTMDGRTYKGYTSQYIENGVMYGLRKGGQNFKKIVPPSYTGLASDPKQKGFVPFQFVAGAITGGGNTLPIYDNVGGDYTRVTEGVQMPGMLRMQLVPDQPAGMILTGVTTDRTFAG